MVRATGANFDGCGKIAMLAEPVEDLIAEAIFQRLDGPALSNAPHHDGDDGVHTRPLGSLRADEDALNGLTADHYVDRIVSRAGFITTRTTLESRIDNTRRTLAARALGFVAVRRGCRATGVG